MQYQIVSIADRVGIVDRLSLIGYTGGTIVGTADITVYRRLLDNAIGFLDFRGIELVGTVPVIDDTLETNTFLESYAILIGSDHYKITSIVGSTMELVGPFVDFGIAGVPASYSIIQFVKTSPITTQDGTVFEFLDRRGNESITITTEEGMPMSFAADLLNYANEGQTGFASAISAQENISVDIIYR